MRQREWAMFKCGSTSPGKVGAVVSRSPKGALPPALTGVETLVNLQRTHGNAFVQRKLVSDFVGNLVPQPPAEAGTKGRPIDPRENRP
jgi:hypothetical protein